MSDTFKSQVYCAKGMGAFLILGREAKPRTGEWVAVEEISAGHIRLQKFRGQRYLSTVTVLEFWDFADSEQRAPGRSHAY
jgi:hypothetical protein